jgi:two-component system chemotaxis sensor kinase CheA
MDSNALKNEFLVESFENLSSINEDLTALEKNPSDKELLNKIYRTVHTMKGSAGFLGYKKLQEVTHSAENLLDELREDNLKLSAEITDTLLQSFDICSAILKSLEGSEDEGESDTSAIKKALDHFLSEEYRNASESASEDVASETTSTNEDSDDELKSLIASHTETEAPKEKKEAAPAGISSAAMDSLKELIGEGKVDASAIEEIEGSQAAAEEKAPATSNISSAAMDSLKELIGEGKVDASAIEEIERTSASQTPKSEAPNKETTAAVSSAAMDSLKELIGEGKVDASAIEEIEGSKASEAKPQDPPAATQVPEKEVVTKEEATTSKAPPAQATAVNDNKSIADSFVRVNVSVLDKIMNIVGELVLNRNQIVQFANQENNHEFTKLSQHLNIITSELQSEVMSTRMQPIGSILTKFERLVRDFSRTTGKKISLRLSGQETELDKTLIEAIKDPLVHIIRNACDHGLEGIEDREAAGKNAQGTIWIKAYNESGQVTIEILDDGRGLNRDKIGAKAVEKGVITSESLERMTDQQVFGLIFAPGFSTAEQVTNISGRGVGMDVVKTNIEKIGGSVNVNSKLGEGTTFKLRIPLTLAIVPALVIKSIGEFFAVPQLNLVELVRLESDEEKALIEKIQGSEFLKLRGNLTPVFRLNDVLELQNVHNKSEQLRCTLDDFSSGGTQDNQNSTTKIEDAENIIILSAEDLFFGIIVDEILDTEEIVVKPLSNSLKHLNLFGGATIMGDGKVALILDALGFLNTVSDSTQRVKEEAFATDEGAVNVDEAGEMQENLLVKLGDERTYAVPLPLVARLEEFEVSKIERTGNQPIIRYLNAPMPLINVEKTLKLNGKSMLERHKEIGKDVISCIVTTIRGKNFGIVVDEIRDISIDHSNIDASAVDREGILGTVFIDDKTVSLLDVYTIIESQGLGIKQSMSKDQVSANKKKKILLVDDSAMYRKMESDALLEQGYQVDLANNGEHGYEVIEKGQYDLLITDIEMPILDGFDFAKRVRQQSHCKDIPIVALSTKCQDKDRVKGKESGFDYHLEKFKKDEVLDLVAKILNGE